MFGAFALLVLAHVGWLGWVIAGTSPVVLFFGLGALAVAAVSLRLAWLGLVRGRAAARLGGYAVLGLYSAALLVVALFPDADPNWDWDDAPRRVMLYLAALWAAALGGGLMARRGGAEG